MKKLADRIEDGLFKRVAEIIEAARGNVARTVNSAMVHAYWLIGREIVEIEQHGKERAGYGEELNRVETLVDLFHEGDRIEPDTDGIDCERARISSLFRAGERRTGARPL